MANKLNEQISVYIVKFMISSSTTLLKKLMIVLNKKPIMGGYDYRSNTTRPKLNQTVNARKKNSM